MATRMLIDARHREETRVAVVQGNRIEEFDFESAEHKQLKGNIYLAKVTRVEPSLQAAFVEYGGNRHGFLAFSEIHPDYYQIPKADRDALLAEEAEHAAEEEKLREAEEGLEPLDEHHEDDGQDHDRPDADAEGDVVEPAESDEEAANGENGNGRSASDESRAIQELKAKRLALRRRYKIQDVIKRRQVMLVQVVKEERGNKGAALTSYLSLAGRYCVLMPNTAHGGGISRKISNSGDRKRLKSIMSDLKLPPTMGCIVRTAGLSRTKTEIKRDFDYLARLWDEIREKTLSAQAPAEIHGDSDLIKRAIRDIYHRDIEEVLVEGEEGYRAAKEFIKLLMPSHAKKVKPYADVVPLFQHFHVEDQLNAMYNPVVQLKSGGYLVINPTEALVSIDINSGRSTREHGIEATALKTNLEAAKEIARQLRLRDMAGLVVIDFIDMESHSNDRKVEKALKEALKDDRARIQVGRISGFGLLEMSRQRLRTGVLEASTRTCPHCEGTGLVRTASSAGLSALRLLEEEAGRGRGSLLELRASTEAAFYVLNTKRTELGEIEERYGVSISISPDGTMEGARMEVQASGPPPREVVRIPPPVIEDDDDLDIIDEDEEEEIETREEREEREEGDGRRRRRRRRRGGRGRREDAPEAGEASEEGDESGASEASADSETSAEGDDEDSPRKRSRRGRRGGRRRGGAREDGEGAADEAAPEAAEPTAVEAEETEAVAVEAKPKRRTRAKKADAEPVEAETEAPAEEPAEKPKRKSRAKKAEPVEAEAPAEPEAKAEKPKRASRAKKPTKDVAEAPAKATRAKKAANDEQEDDDGEPRRGGWWQRTFGP